MNHRIIKAQVSILLFSLLGVVFPYSVHATGGYGEAIAFIFWLGFLLVGYLLFIYFRFFDSRKNTSYTGHKLALHILLTILTFILLCIPLIGIPFSSWGLFRFFLFQGAYFLFVPWYFFKGLSLYTRTLKSASIVPIAMLVIMVLAIVWLIISGCSGGSVCL